MKSYGQGSVLSVMTMQIHETPMSFVNRIKELSVLDAEARSGNFIVVFCLLI